MWAFAKRSAKSFASDLRQQIASPIHLLQIFFELRLISRPSLTYPEFTKKHTDSFSGNKLVIFWAHNTKLSWRNLLLVFKTFICSTPALTTSGWQWPTIKGMSIFSLNQSCMNKLDVKVYVGYPYRELHYLCNPNTDGLFHHTCIGLRHEQFLEDWY